MVWAVKPTTTLGGGGGGGGGGGASKTKEQCPWLGCLEDLNSLVVVSNFNLWLSARVAASVCPLPALVSSQGRGDKPERCQRWKGEIGDRVILLHTFRECALHVCKGFRCDLVI